jgi:L-ascorbate metabolism protein UlaG (beta-lactamase superfamily)
VIQYKKRRRRYFVDGMRAGARFGDLLRWQLLSRRAKWPRTVETPKYPGPLPAVYRKALSATWLGQSTVLLQTDGLNILTDPFLSARASPLSFAGPKRVLPAPFRPHELPNIDIVLLSHNHYDHLDVPGLRALIKNHQPKFITPLGNKRYLNRVSRWLDVIELDWRQSVEVINFRITAMPAWHWSKRGFDDSNLALWGAFVVETPGGVIYFAGDTGYGDGSTFREVEDRFGSPRLSLLPIGAYEPRWFMEPMHMNPDDAVKAHLDLGSQTSLGIHHSTIQLTNEAIDQPIVDLEVALQSRSLERRSFITPNAGETVAIS